MQIFIDGLYTWIKTERKRDAATRMSSNGSGIVLSRLEVEGWAGKGGSDI